jgi:hypothetical protein
MLIFQPPVNFCSEENIQTIFGTKLEDFLNYRIDYTSVHGKSIQVLREIFAIFWLCKFTSCLFPCLPIISYQVRIYKRLLIIPDLKERTINIENKE